MNKKHKHITVIGNVGTGKSTVTALLAEAMAATLVKADELYKVNPFFSLTLEDRSRWSLASDLWFLHERMKLAHTTQIQLEKAPVVVDSGLLMSFVYAHSRTVSGFFIPEEWDLYQGFYDQLVTAELLPDKVIFLTAPIDFLRQRIIKRGRDFEIKHHSKAYLSDLATSLDAVKAYVQQKSVPLVEYDMSKHEFIDNPQAIQQLVDQVL